MMTCAWKANLEVGGFEILEGFWVEEIGQLNIDLGGILRGEANCGKKFCSNFFKYKLRACSFRFDK